MLSFDLLGVDFADGVSRGREVASTASRRSGVKVHQPKRLAHFLQLSEDLLSPASHYLGPHHPSATLHRAPPPALLGFAPHEPPSPRPPPPPPGALRP